MKTTPAPWRVIADLGETNVYRLWDAGYDYPLPRAESIQRANARLMSAAPDLLAALQQIHDNPDGARIIAAEAIRRATE